MEAEITMLRNYILIALRNIQRHKVYAFIKIFGLSLGIAACILIYLFIMDELSFDRFHENGDRLFRVVQIQYNRESGRETARDQFLPAPMGPQLMEDFPEILHQSRYVSGTGVVKYRDKIFSETLTMTDPAFFAMFTFPLAKGNPQTALSANRNLVLTKAAAKKYFGDDDPLGKIMNVSTGLQSRDFIVTGVAENLPAQSSLQFDIVIPFANLPSVMNDLAVMNDWNRWYCPLFIQVAPGTAAAAIENRMDQFTRLYFGAKLQKYRDTGGDPFTFGLQPLRDIHLDARVAGTRGMSSSYLLAAIALAILLIASVNFTNLSIGLSSIRSTEVGMRKVMGAERRHLIRQFLGETLVIAFFAVILGLILAELLLSQFNALAGKTLSFRFLFNRGHWIGLLILMAGTGIAAGGYPAVIMSGLRPVEIMKGKLKIGGKTLLTQGLVVLQFTLSVILIISAITLGRQVSYLVNKDPGYTSDGLVVIMTQENELEASERVTRLFRNEIISGSGIEGVTASNREFGLFLPQTALEWKDTKIYYNFNRVDPDFLGTMKFTLVAGRDFSPTLSGDSAAVIINERFRELLGPDFALGSPLGDPAGGFPYHCRVIGVIKDSHFQSLRSEINPLLLYTGAGEAPNRDRFSRVIVRINTDHLKETMGFLESSWRKISPDKPFTHYFQDTALRSLYDRERRWSAIVRYASVLSILLACLGVFGLTAMTLGRREKEIGIRKVLGASTEQIVFMAMKEFVVLITVANIIAWPIVFFVMRNVLQNYPYRIGIGAGYYLLAGAVSIAIAVLTILFISVKAALANPAESLKYE